MADNFYLIDIAPVPEGLLDTRRYTRRKKPRPRKVKPPPPTMKELLRKAYALRKRLKETPGLTHEALAKEEGMELTRLKQILSLLNLVHVIQHYILTTTPLPNQLTEKQLLRLTKIQDKRVQLEEFAQFMR